MGRQEQENCGAASGHTFQVTSHLFQASSDAFPSCVTDGYFYSEMMQTTLCDVKAENSFLTASLWDLVHSHLRRFQSKLLIL